MQRRTCTTHAITHCAARTRPFGELHEPSMEPSLVRTQLLSLRVSVMPPPALLLERLLQLRALQLLRAAIPQMPACCMSHASRCMRTYPLVSACMCVVFCMLYNARSFSR
jgi:hypothetical protein